MTSEFITRVEREKDEPYTVIFRTDDADKYKHIEDECRKMIGHAKPTVDAVPVVHGEWIDIDGTMFAKCSVCGKRHYGCTTPYCDMCGAKMQTVTDCHTWRRANDE